MRYGLEQDTECGFGFHLFPLHVQLQSNVTRTAEVCMLSLSCSFASFEVHLLVCAVDFVNIFLNFESSCIIMQITFVCESVS